MTPKDICCSTRGIELDFDRLCEQPMTWHDLNQWLQMWWLDFWLLTLHALDCDGDINFTLNSDILQDDTAVDSDPNIDM